MIFTSSITKWSIALCCISSIFAEDLAPVESDDLALAGAQDNERPLSYMFSSDRLDVGLSYSALIQGSIGEGESGGSGELSFAGRWIFVDEKYPSKLLERIGSENDGSLSLKWRLRHRHALLDIPASELNYAIGSFLGTTDGFSNSGFEIPELYIQNVFHDGRIELRYGQLSVESRLDGHALRGAKRSFLNRVFSTNPTVAFPRFGAGALARWQATDKLDLTYALTQVQASKSGAQIDFDLSSDNLFTGLQAGLTWGENGDTPSRLQFMAWGSDSTSELEEDYGWSLNYELQLDKDQKSIFARLAESRGRQTDLERMAVLGYGQNCLEGDLLGIGAGVGQSSETGGVQGVLELFYRYQSPYKLQITPDIQLHVGDDLEGDFSVVAGLRGHLDF